MYEIFIRPLKESDALISWKWRNDPEVWKYTGNRPDRQITHEIEKEWITNVLKRNNEMRYAVCIEGTNQYIGNVQLTHITDIDAEFHIFIGEKEFWGKGLGTKITRAFLDLAFEKKNLNNIYLYVNNQNIAAVKAYRNVGFRECGSKEGMLKMIAFRSSRETMVSIFMMTYNHGKFIREALDGIVNQVCNFNFDLVIGDDYSSDDTRAIIKKYTQKHSNIKLIFQSENVGPHANQFSVLKNCCGKYIAVCEGDDYWTDLSRLQKQVDFLESHPDYNMTLGRYQLYYQNSGKYRNNFELFNINKPLSLKNYIAFNFGHTSTFLFRNSFEIPDWLNTVFSGDQSIFIINAKEKKVKYFNDFFSVYRVNDGGVTKIVNSEKSYNNTKNFLNTINEYTQRKYHLLINNRKRLNKLYYYFESAGNPLLKNFIRIPIIFLRWWGINVLVKFVKD